MRRHRFNAILVSLVVVGFVTVDLFVALAAQQNCEPDGDLNRDGEVTAVDALMAFSHALNMTTLDACQEMIGDVFPSPASPDGAFTAADALCIYARAHGRPSCLDALVEEVGRGDLIARVVDETDPELPGHLDLLELAVYSSTATGVIFEITTRERYRAGQFYRLHFDTDEPFWSDWSQDYDFSWGVDVEAERNGIWSTGPTTPELLALDGNRLTLLADIGEGFSASVIAGVGPIDGEWIQSDTSESGVVDVVGDGETAAQAFPRHGVGTFFSYVVNDHADPDDDPFQLSYQVTGRDAYRGREVSVVKVSGRFVDPAHNYDYTDLWDAESGNTVVSDLDSDHEIQYTPHLGWMSFPMKVGKDWRATYTERHTSTSQTCVDSADRSLEPVCETVKHTEEEVVWADLEVVAYEAVTVPAGTFMAFRVTLTDSSCDADPDCIWDSGSYWYAPEVGYFVKVGHSRSHFYY